MPPLFFSGGYGKARRMIDPPRVTLSPEWNPQESVWVGWPTLPEEWGDAFEPARGEIAEFVRVLSKYVRVHIVAGSAIAAASASAHCGDHAAIHRLPLGDIWLRDTGPIIAKRDDTPTALQFRFDGWGGKFVIPGDTETARAIAQELSLTVKSFDFSLEGGAVEYDGHGNLITTRQCLLDGVRNPDWGEAAAEHHLKSALGAVRVIWLDRGLINDHTDGHVDNVARFIAPGRAVCQRPSGSDDPNAEIYEAIEQTLRASGLHVDTLPSPGRIERGGAPVPASHLNFLITNGAVIMPAFENTYALAAARALETLFAGRTIYTLPARQILAGGGTFHCMTRDIPDFAQKAETT